MAAVFQMEIDDFENHYARFFAKDVKPEINTNITRQLASARDALRRGGTQETRHALEEASGLLNGFLSDNGPHADRGRQG
jgi:hypothetical protein